VNVCAGTRDGETHQQLYVGEVEMWMQSLSMDYKRKICMARALNLKLKLDIFSLQGRPQLTVRHQKLQKLHKNS